MKLTELKIEKLAAEPGRKDRLVFDNEQRGLAVRVTRSGGRTYLCQYTLHGRKWRVPLGACSGVSLADARKAAAAVMGDVAKGRNPATDRKQAAAAERARRVRNRLTLRVLIEDWRRMHLAGRRPSYAAEAVRALHHAFADYLDDAAEDLDRTTVVSALDGLTRRRSSKDGGNIKGTRGSAMAGRTASYGRTAFTWAVRRGAVSANPFADLPIPKGAAKRERVLGDDELAEIWRAAGQTPAPYGTIVRLLILTGQRRGEVAGMRWNEISEDLATWSMPGNRTKNGVAHVVPLSPAARNMLRCLLPDDEDRAKRALTDRRGTGTLVLPGAVGTEFAGWSKAKSALDEAIKDARAKSALSGATLTPLAAWSVHDLRRTVATGLQRLGVRLEVTEAVLNHISGSRGGIAGVYQRHDWAQEKRAALDGWATHVAAAIEGRTARSNVVALALTGCQTVRDFEIVEVAPEFEPLFCALLKCKTIRSHRVLAQTMDRLGAPPRSLCLAPPNGVQVANEILKSAVVFDSKADGDMAARMLQSEQQDTPLNWRNLSSAEKKRARRRWDGLLDVRLEATAPGRPAEIDGALVVYCAQTIAAACGTTQFKFSRPPAGGTPRGPMFRALMAALPLAQSRLVRAANGTAASDPCEINNHPEAVAEIVNITRSREFQVCCRELGIGTRDVAGHPKMIRLALANARRKRRKPRKLVHKK